MSEKLCPQCGKETGGANFCPHCGFALNEQQESVSISCPKCGKENPKEFSFCQYCGASLKQETGGKPPAEETKKFQSTGTYNGKMTTKAKSSGGRKIFKIFIIILLVVGAAALYIWYKTDPTAPETLSRIAFGIVAMLIFIFFIFRKSKKSNYRGRSSSGNFYYGDKPDGNLSNYDDKDDDNDDGGGWDDGGDSDD